MKSAYPAHSINEASDDRMGAQQQARESTLSQASGRQADKQAGRLAPRRSSRVCCAQQLHTIPALCQGSSPLKLALCHPSLSSQLGRSKTGRQAGRVGASGGSELSWRQEGDNGASKRVPFRSTEAVRSAMPR